VPSNEPSHPSRRKRKQVGQRTHILVGSTSSKANSASEMPSSKIAPVLQNQWKWTLRCLGLDGQPRPPLASASHIALYRPYRTNDRNKQQRVNHVTQDAGQGQNSYAETTSGAVAQIENDAGSDSDALNFLGEDRCLSIPERPIITALACRPSG